MAQNTVMPTPITVVVTQPVKGPTVAESMRANAMKGPSGPAPALHDQAQPKKG